MLNRIEMTPRASTAATPARAPATAANSRFADVLHAQLESAPRVKLSGHAQQRLQHRDIALSQEEMNSVDDALRKLAAKGGREALVLLPRAALLVNVPNRTIITAMPSDELQSSVFTNIDSAVIVSPAGPQAGGRTEF